MSIFCLYRGVLFLPRYCGIRVLVYKSILCPAADAASSDSWLILFKVLTLSVSICTVLLYLSNFCLSVSFKANYSNTKTKAPTSAERAPYLPAQRAMRFRYMVWVNHGNLSMAVFLSHQLTSPLLIHCQQEWKNKRNSRICDVQNSDKVCIEFLISSLP